MNTGIKVAIPGVDAARARSDQLAMSSQYSNLKCDLRKQPRNYGILNFSIASLSAAVTLFQQKHDYKYVPAFLVAWNYPTGTTPADGATNSTFGIGNVDASLGNGLVITISTDNQNFTITATPLSGTLTNVQGTLRFFIYADDFPAS